MNNTKPQIICTIGIPGSGKSTWAIKYAEKNPNTTIVERDEIRARNHTFTGNLSDYKFSKTKEEMVTNSQEFLIKHAVWDGNSAIVSDTNLNAKTRKRMEVIAAKLNTELVWKVFDVPLYQCMKWNLKRPYPVPESVLIRMEQKMRKYLGKYVHDRANPEGLPSCVIMDIDGTLADMKGIRRPYEWDKVDQDKVIPYVAEYARSLYEQSKQNLFIFSGRDGSCRGLTEKWLEHHNIRHDGLFMRTAGDQRNDTIIKEELFDKYIKGKYHVSHVVDDRAQVCKLYESMGFQVMNVGGFLADF